MIKALSEIEVITLGTLPAGGSKRVSKYSPSDDGKTIDGKIVIFVYPEGQGPGPDGASTAGA